MPDADPIEATNLEAQRRVIARVADALGMRGAEPTAGPVQRNYFSWLFTLDFDLGPTLVVKMPRTDLRRRPGDAIPVQTADDRALARAEHNSLTFLSGAWSGSDLGVQWVTAACYIDEFSAVVTQRVDAREVTDRYRALALAGLAGRQAPRAALEQALGRFGSALGRLHRDQGRAVDCDAAPVVNRIHRYAGAIEALAGSRSLFTRLRAVLAPVARERLSTSETTTLKGIDIRNLLEAADGKLWLVDPGKIKRTAREADLARFLVTWRTLFWGTPWFALRVSPPPGAERAFLQAYWAGEPGPGRLLRLYETKELLKHWHTALESLALKRYRGSVRTLLQRGYIDPFYRHSVARQVELLS